MYKLGETFQRDGFLELRQEGDLYLLKIGDCFDDGGEGVCMPLFSFTKKLSSKTSTQNILSPPSHKGGIFAKGEDVFFGVR
jgi:hypothetical protein